MGLLKNAHLLCWAANRIAQRIFIYASRFGFSPALHLNIFEQPQNVRSLQDPMLYVFRQDVDLFSEALERNKGKGNYERLDCCVVLTRRQFETGKFRFRPGGPSR
jgi:hypothetical protein